MEIARAISIHEKKSQRQNNLITYPVYLPSQIKNNYIGNHHKISNEIININQSKQNNEYLLTSNFFDPSQSSPPNDFLLKLHMRIEKYQKNVINEYNE